MKPLLIFLLWAASFGAAWGQGNEALSVWPAGTPYYMLETLRDYGAKPVGWYVRGHFETNVVADEVGHTFAQHLWDNLTNECDDVYWEKRGMIIAEYHKPQAPPAHTLTTNSLFPIHIVTEEEATVRHGVALSNSTNVQLLDVGLSNIVDVVTLQTNRVESDNHRTGERDQGLLRVYAITNGVADKSGPRLATREQWEWEYCKTGQHYEFGGYSSYSGPWWTPDWTAVKDDIPATERYTDVTITRRRVLSFAWHGEAVTIQREEPVSKWRETRQVGK